MSGRPGDLRRGDAGCRQHVPRSVHDADAPALHPSVAAPGDRAALPARPNRDHRRPRLRRRGREAARRSLHARRAAPRVPGRRASCRRSWRPSDRRATSGRRPRPARRRSPTVASPTPRAPTGCPAGWCAARASRRRGDAAVDQAYDGLGDTFEMFARVFARDSIDDAGMPLEATVHYGDRYDNAFWDGERMVFGDGDGEVFRGFTAVDQRDRARARARRHRAHGATALPGPVGRAQRARLRRVRRAGRAVRRWRRMPSRRRGSSARACSPTPSRGAPSGR